MYPPIERLKLMEGVEPSEGHVRVLTAQISAQAKLRGGRGVSHKWYPWGVLTRFSGGRGGGGSSPIFEPSVARDEISWAFGIIAGREPTIQGAPISSGVTYTIPPDAFAANGQALVFFRLNLDHDLWLPADGAAHDGSHRAAVSPVAFAQAPTPEPWTAFKLAAIVDREAGLIHRPLYSDLGFVASSRHSTSGLSTPIFFPVS